MSNPHMRELSTLKSVPLQRTLNYRNLLVVPIVEGSGEVVTLENLRL